MSETKTSRRQRGRPRVPAGRRRENVTVRLRPALLRRMIETAEIEEHSLSQEIEYRCQMFEDLAASAQKGPVIVIAKGSVAIGQLRAVLQHRIPGLDLIFLPLPGNRARRFATGILAAVSDPAGIVKEAIVEEAVVKGDEP
jgi:hypothetical protein